MRAKNVQHCTPRPGSFCFGEARWLMFNAWAPINMLLSITVPHRPGQASGA